MEMLQSSAAIIVTNSSYDAPADVLIRKFKVTNYC